MDLLIGLVVGSLLAATFPSQARWTYRLMTGGYFFKDAAPPTKPE